MGYAKTIIAVIAAGLVALQTAITDGHITGAEWITVALAALGAVGVWAVPNARRTVSPPDRHDGPAPRSMDLP